MTLSTSIQTSNSPGALVKILVKSGKNVTKLIFSEYARDIIYINLSKAKENPPGAYISELTFEVRATLMSCRVQTLKIDCILLIL